MSLTTPEMYDNTADEVRLLIVRRAEAIRMAQVCESAFSRAANVFWELDYPDDREDLRRDVITTFFEFMDAGREARAQEHALDRALGNLAKVPMPEEVLA